ncbi:MAG: biopolymer transporter ExbD [Candidatus Electrothrix sp. EH2]|nr:biopolymer transporter ExbD [Candidatus Electrothrix sp. EH2]
MKLNRQGLMEPPRVEMLPLIDIVFLLLVFFIYAMLSMAVHHGQRVDLPESGTAGLETAEAVSITIRNKDDSLELFVDEDRVELPQLEELLAGKKKKGGAEDPDVQIFADKSVSYQGLFRVLDQVRRAGLSKISLQAEAE